MVKKNIPLDMQAGTIFLTKSSGELEILDYVNKHKVSYRFPKTGFTGHAEARSIRAGQVKDKLKPIIYYAGYMGDTENVTEYDKKAYTVWRDILKRCYDPKESSKLAYRGMKVADEWHDFSNFKAWHDVNYVEGFSIDKDLLGNNSNIYSPDNCIYLPRYLNNLIIDNTTRSELPVGVFFKDNSYRAEVYNEEKRYPLGKFNNKEDASKAYSHAKAVFMAKATIRMDTPQKAKGVLIQKAVELNCL